jgi:hypothetical protein
VWTGVPELVFPQCSLEVVRVSGQREAGARSAETRSRGFQPVWYKRTTMWFTATGATTEREKLECGRGVLPRVTPPRSAPPRIDPIVS